LVDSYDPVQRGGTGRTARWDLLFPRPIEFRHVPILLAGGLKSENISQAIQTAQPDGIDIASGIESAPGVKDHSKMQAISAIALPLLG
jgi:phosphoribosylanthranilate isomerase